MISQVIIVTVTLLGYVIATNYRGRYGGAPDKAVGSEFGIDASSGYGGDQNPYQFHYIADDGRGNNHYRNEQRYQTGAVRGTYGYRNARGLYRVVQYVADARGFRAKITTNEPGTDVKENPASVNFMAEQPSAGIQDTWTKARGAGGNEGGDVPASVQKDSYYPPIEKFMPKLKLSNCETEENFNLKECLMGVGSGL